MPRPEFRRMVAVAGLVLSLGGCDFYYNDVPSPDDLMHAIPWFNSMIWSPAVYPYETAHIPRNTIPGTVPVTGGSIGDWSAEWRVGNTTTADALVNPGDGTPTARGDTLYQWFCAVCHGQDGGGSETVGPRMGAPHINTDRVRGFSDGYIYSIIRYGRGVMPRYGDKVYDPADRWAIVNYVRKLGTPVASPTQPAADPSGGAQ